MKAFLLSFLLCASAHAEYRVFTLMINNEKTNESRQFDSTLDPDQYQTFFPLKAGETIVYIDTWRCFGRTSGFKQLCAKPEPQLQPQTQTENRAPSSEN